MTTKSRIDEGRRSGDVPRIAYPIEEAAVVAGVARSRMFEAVRTKKITARKAGRATIIEHHELVAYVRSLPTVGKQSPSTGNDVA
jgi:ribosomal protein L25 (general stress protein Ctc)